MATGDYVLEAATITDSTGTTDATPLDLNVLKNGIIDPVGDEDYFEFTLDERTDVTIRSTGSLNTVAELRDDEGNLVAYNDDGFLSGRQFTIRALLDAGTYYLQVTGHHSSPDNNTGLCTPSRSRRSRSRVAPAALLRCWKWAVGAEDG